MNKETETGGKFLPVRDFFSASFIILSAVKGFAYFESLALSVQKITKNGFYLYPNFTISLTESARGPK